MAEYWAHWLTFAFRTDAAKLPKIFYVNWFRKDADGSFLWPGFAENSRVLAWVFERCAGHGRARISPIGYLPGEGAIDHDDLAISERDWTELFRIDPDEWREEVVAIRSHYATFGNRVPQPLVRQLNALAARLRTGQ
jgi:phosphoenolpyruvate carboxykinase (GTP)